MNISHQARHQNKRRCFVAFETFNDHLICSKTNQQKQDQKEQLLNKRAISYNCNEVKPPYALWLPVDTATIKTAWNTLLLVVSRLKKIKKWDTDWSIQKQKTKTKQQPKPTDRYLLMSSLGSYLLPDTKHAQIRRTGSPSIILRWKWSTEAEQSNG